MSDKIAYDIVESITKQYGDEVWIGSNYGPGDELRALIAHAIAARDTRVAELQAIVDKLPKCWRLDLNGKLVQDAPVVPGESYYAVWMDESEWDGRDDSVWRVSGCRYVGHATPWVDFEWEILGCEDMVMMRGVANSPEAAAALAASKSAMQGQTEAGASETSVK